ncbi:hypothetical protein [Histidinibacterium lentulum]|uniref:Uncharacterized protein n=1 Tax=Histidinibacterium lentulum TaxID=2480588 RepID=A0A3N2QYI7_9RHOB|nr:hypothetical protein [Histidinibacterium lentulum]ROU00271.1 hypothetical protein EAT49_13540 [Histidinibacterium lentulum]
MGTLIRLLALVALLPLPALAAPDTPEDRLRTFATCAGRLSARLEHHWLMSDPPGETESHRETTLDILALLTPPDRATEALALRIQAKASFAALLSRATFGTDPADRLWAETHARRLLAPCTDLLLG